MALSVLSAVFEGSEAKALVDHQYACVVEDEEEVRLPSLIETCRKGNLDQRLGHRPPRGHALLAHPWNGFLEESSQQRPASSDGQKP